MTCLSTRCHSALNVRLTRRAEQFVDVSKYLKTKILKKCSRQANIRKFKQVRTTTTLKKQLKILVFKGNHGLLTTCCIFNEHFMTSKKVQSFKVSKIIVLAILKSILSKSFNRYVS